MCAHDYSRHACDNSEDMCQRDCMRRYFVNSRCGWYLKAFEGAFEISMTCLVVFSLVVSIVLDVMHVIICTSQLPGEPAVSWDLTCGVTQCHGHADAYGQHMHAVSAGPHEALARCLAQCQVRPCCCPGLLLP